MADGSASPETVLDLRGLKCPQPVLRLRRALAAAAPGARIVVHCTDPMAAIDVPHLLRETGDRLIEASRRGDVLTFRVERGGRGETAG